MQLKFKVGEGKTAKEVVINEITVSDQRTSAKNVGECSNEAELQIAAQQELLKILLVSVDGKALKGHEKENLGNVFSWKEYNQVMKVVQDMMGNESEMPKVEIVTA